MDGSAIRGERATDKPITEREMETKMLVVSRLFNGLRIGKISLTANKYDSSWRCLRHYARFDESVVLWVVYRPRLSLNTRCVTLHNNSRSVTVQAYRLRRNIAQNGSKLYIISSFSRMYLYTAFNFYNSFLRSDHILYIKT